MSEYRSSDGDELTYEDMEEVFEEFLDETHDSITVGGIEFLPGHILRYCDPIAFRSMLLDYIDFEIQSGELEEI